METVLIKTKKVIRTKKPIASMMPVKQWLGKAEACAYLDMSINIFNDVSKVARLTTSVIGKKTYYKVSEINELLTLNIVIHKK